jgi:hypothetical protein
MPEKTLDEMVEWLYQEVMKYEPGERVVHDRILDKLERFAPEFITFTDNGWEYRRDLWRRFRELHSGVLGPRTTKKIKKPKDEPEEGGG